MKRVATALVGAVFALGTLGTGIAAADPDFGPGAGNGQGNNHPQDQGAKCHPPGQTVDTPGCK